MKVKSCTFKHLHLGHTGWTKPNTTSPVDFQNIKRWQWTLTLSSSSSFTFFSFLFLLYIYFHRRKLILTCNERCHLAGYADDSGHQDNVALLRTEVFGASEHRDVVLTHSLQAEAHRQSEHSFQNQNNQRQIRHYDPWQELLWAASFAMQMSHQHADSSCLQHVLVEEKRKKEQQCKHQLKRQ